MGLCAFSVWMIVDQLVCDLQSKTFHFGLVFYQQIYRWIVFRLSFGKKSRRVEHPGTAPDPEGFVESRRYTRIESGGTRSRTIQRIHRESGSRDWGLARNYSGINHLSDGCYRHEGLFTCRRKSRNDSLWWISETSKRPLANGDDKFGSASRS
jgi:hypothetical protein